MSLLLWILQWALAFLYVAGGAYKSFKPEDLARQLPGLPAGAWRLFGVTEMAGGLLLVLPPFVGGRPDLVPLAALLLALETFLLAALYGRRSLRIAAANPFVWAAAMGLLAVGVAYGRHALAPFA
jgi:hypothetical protein